MSDVTCISYRANVRVRILKNGIKAEMKNNVFLDIVHAVADIQYLSN